MKKIKIAIVGASGYTGVELIRLLLSHPNVEISALVANSNAGSEIGAIYQHLKAFDLPILQKIDEVDFAAVDAVFCCLPHGTSQEIIAGLADKYSSLKIIDLSADFRLFEAKDYEKWYGHEHFAPNLQKKAVYGLPEFKRDKVKKTNLVACPGCYPTSILLPLLPLFDVGLVEGEVIADSKSGVSGAGRSLKEANLFCENNDSFRAYSVGGHRHLAEIEQEISLLSEDSLDIEFTPHLIPVNRGIISTIYVNLKDGFGIEDAKNCLKTKYEDEYFVDLIEDAPKISDVVRTNFCEIAAFSGRGKNRLILVCALDNLCKGASGQAVQNFNIMFGLDERLGLEFLPIFP